MHRLRDGAALWLAVFLALAPSAWGAGFALFEHSGRGLGSAFAGEAAVAEDATTIYFNPAGLTLLNGTQFASSGFAIIPATHFHNEGSHLNPDVGGGRLRGNDGGDAGGHALIPTFFLAHELTSRVRLGFGVSTPFGLSTKYEGRWVGRYHAISSTLETVNVNPTIAVKLTDWVSLGGGADIEYAKARLTNALDMGSICQIFGAPLGVTPEVCTDVLGLRPQGADGFVKVSGDDWNVGYNLGVLFTPSKTWRLGLAYRSKIHHTIGGRATFRVPQKASILPKVSGALVDTDGRANVDLPERLSLSGFQQLTPALALLADVTWTHWDRFDELRFEFANPKQPTIVQPEGWRDSYRFSLGGRWKPWRRWTFRLGTAYDMGTVPNAQLRTPRIPESDRIWIASGVGLQAFDRLALSLGYAHLFALERKIDNADPVTGHVIRGRYTAEADIVGVQLTWDVGWPPL